MQHEKASQLSTEVPNTGKTVFSKGYSILRFSDSDALAGLLSGAGINEVTVDEHHTTYTVPDNDTL
jgi:hypothetical protein